MNIMEKIAQEKAPANMPPFRPGDTVRVHVKIREGDKERIQMYEGVVIRKSRANNSFTVRKTSFGVGVERVFPFDSPAVDRVDIASHGKVRQSRLYYLRELRGKKARIQQRTKEELAAKGQRNVLTTEGEAAAEATTEAEA